MSSSVFVVIRKKKKIKLTKHLVHLHNTCQSNFVCGFGDPAGMMSLCESPLEFAWNARERAGSRGVLVTQCLAESQRQSSLTDDPRIRHSSFGDNTNQSVSAYWPPFIITSQRASVC